MRREVPLPDRPHPSPTPVTRWVPRPRVLTLTPVVALLGVLVALVGIVVALRPLSTPTQDCGTAATFLVTGGVNEFHDPADPPEGATEAGVRDNNRRPCQERAAGRGRRALALVAAGTVAGLAAVVVEATVRFRLRRTIHRDLLLGSPVPADPGTRRPPDDPGGPGAPDAPGGGPTDPAGRSTDGGRPVGS